MIEIPLCSIGNTIDTNWNTCVRLLGPNDELPLPDNIEELYLDFETTSEEPHTASINPHKTEFCKILGIAFLFDNEKIPYYLPVRHAYLNEDGDYCYRQHDCANVSPEKVRDWLKKLFQRTKRWVNHNIKYDVHVLWYEVGIDPVQFGCKILDTLTLSKLSEIEERFEYGLTGMMRLLGIDITPYEHRIKATLGRWEGKDLKDYGLIPPFEMAPYAAVDTLCVRHLQHNLKISKECEKVVDMEVDLLPMLIQVERLGIHVDINKIKQDWENILPKQVKRIQRIKHLMGMEYFDPGKKECLYDLFVNRLKWELDYTATSKQKYEKGEITEGEMTVSFGYASIMNHIKKHPRLVSTWIKYQEDQKLLTSFTQPYLEKHVADYCLIHSTFNQIVRTGRMSNNSPNMQQLPIRAKEYMIPYTDDYVLVEFDLSQIEFRVIVHYINNQKCIRDYNDDPTTDFHKWVAKMCGVDRKPAKNINFMLGYGGGKQKCVAMLSELPEIIGELQDQQSIVERAHDVYASYHRALPELKPTQWRASEVLRARGYVKTLLGRQRHLPKKLHFKAFNSVCQGSAADIQKWLTLYRIKKFLGPDCLLQLLVHDSWIFSIRKERVEELIPLIKREIETPIPDIKLAVPIMSGVTISDRNWRGCEDDTSNVKKVIKLLERIAE